MAALAISIYTILLFSFANGVSSKRFDTIDLTGMQGSMMKLLRQMGNETQADPLNLPANATSIRPNITDTFSCENRTYGYYADVDNECQIFHVCLPSQTTSGRNVTYKWSFICPNETVFNQEVLVCTYPRDAIDCEDSPMYYYLNADIGKMNETQSENVMEQQNANFMTSQNQQTNANTIRKDNRRPILKKDGKLMKREQNAQYIDMSHDNKIQMNSFEELKMNNSDKVMNTEDIPEINAEVIDINAPVTMEEEKTNKDDNKELLEDVTQMIDQRLISARKRKRGVFKFKADV